VYAMPGKLLQNFPLRCYRSGLPNCSQHTPRLLLQDVFPNGLQNPVRHPKRGVCFGRQGAQSHRNTDPSGWIRPGPGEFKKSDLPDLTDFKISKMSKKIMFPSEFVSSGVTFSPLERNKAGGKQAFVNATDSKDKLYIQLPAMVSPFGISAYKDPSTGKIMSYNMDLSFRQADENPKVGDALEMIKFMDDALLKHATEHSEEWFGKSMDEQVVKEFMRPLLRHNNPEYPPSLRLKIPVINGMETCRFFDQQKQEVSMEYASKKGTTIMCICEVSPIWFVNKSFGTTLKAVQVCATRVPNEMAEYAFLEDEDQEPGENVVRDSAPMQS
jgi:hypothetical protein